MKNRKLKKIGDTVEIELTRKFKIKGKVKGYRKSYGFLEYLVSDGEVTNGKVDDFYVRRLK